MNKIIKLKESKSAPLVALCVVQCIIHIFMGFVRGTDDIAFQQYFSVFVNWQWQVTQFYEWASRIIINNTAIFIAGLNILVWRILDILMISLIPYSLTEICCKGYKREFRYFVVALWLAYPMMQMMTAGWVVTTISYLWPISSGLYSGILIKKAVCDETLQRHQLVLGILALLYSCNAEQNAVVFVVIMSVLLGYSLYRKHNIKLLAILWLLCILSLLVHLLCPGNANRSIASISMYFPDYQMLSLVEKLQLGFVEIEANMFLGPTWIHLLLCILVCIFAWKTHKQFWIRFASTVPLAVQLGVGFFGQILSDWFPNTKYIPNTSPEIYQSAYAQLVNLDNYHLAMSYIPVMVLFFSMCCLAIGIYYCFRSKSKALFTVLLYFCSVGAGMMMGFSPSIYASGYRTHICTYACIMLVISLLFQENQKRLSIMEKQALYTFMFIVAAFTVFSQGAMIVEVYFGAIQ